MSAPKQQFFQTGDPGHAVPPVTLPIFAYSSLKLSLFMRLEPALLALLIVY